MRGGERRWCGARSGHGWEREGNPDTCSRRCIRIPPLADLEPWFSRYNAWSYSRHRIWNLCRRQYYYQYIGVAIRGPAEPDAFRLKRLKALRSKYALQGLLIHEVIENQIGQYQAGNAPDEEEVKARFSRRIGQYRETAREMVTEFYHGHPEDAAFFDRMRDEGLAKISRFFAVIWPNLQDLMYLKHEEFDRFMLNNVAVTVKVDYVSRAGDGTIVLTDWKTGEDRDEYESDLQMGIYVLWAMQYYGSDPEGIRSGLASLLTGTMRSYSFSYEDLWRIKQTILDDFTAMNVSSAIGAYPASPAPGKCMSCPYATVCPESRRGEYVAGKV